MRFDFPFQEGTLAAVPDFKLWPMQDPPRNNHYLPFIGITNCTYLTMTGNGLLDGQGLKWWNKWIFDPPHNSRRPNLVEINTCQYLLIENIRAINSPSFHFDLGNVAHAEVRRVEIHVNRKAIRQLKAVKRSKRLGLSPSITVADISPAQPRAPFRAAMTTTTSNLMATTPKPVLEPEDLNTDGIDPSGR